MLRMTELCRKLKPVLGNRIDRLWSAYLSETDHAARARIEQMLEMLSAKHLGTDYQPDRSPFPPPDASFCEAGDIPLGKVTYAGEGCSDFRLKSDRLKEHLLVCGRSGSGKTNLTFILLQGIMDQGIKVLAMDWKRGYRDLRQLRDDLRIYTIGREVSPFRFNPLIPPQGCKPGHWIKLIVDVIASAYFGGEGVISLLVSGLDHLYREMGIYEGHFDRWPTITDLLAWLRATKLTGRAAMWKASAERILLAMTYGEFGAVVQTQDNSHLLELLSHNVILEMDGLSSNSDRVMFSEALTLWLYRHRLAQGPRKTLTNLIVLEEAHNLLLAKQPGSRESVLETSIRMIRQYGLGYVFVDQSASMLSKVAFANSYAMIALSQKLKGDVQSISAAMNLTDIQKQALNTLPVGTAVIRLSDEYPEPFQIAVPLCPIREGGITDDNVRRDMGRVTTDSGANRVRLTDQRVIPPIPDSERRREILQCIVDSASSSSHPPPDEQSSDVPSLHTNLPTTPPSGNNLPEKKSPDLSREAIRFLADIAARPLSTTVVRYQRLHLSRRRGNAIRKDLQRAGIIAATSLATRSGQVVLYELTDAGRSICRRVGIDTPPRPAASLEHRYWVKRISQQHADDGYELIHEHRIKGNGDIDILAAREGERIAIEVETGKSDVRKNLSKLLDAGFDRIVILATSPEAMTVCQKAIDETNPDDSSTVQLLSWLDIS